MRRRTARGACREAAYPATILKTIYASSPRYILVTWFHTTATSFLAQGEATTSQGGSRNEICSNSASGTRHRYTAGIANLYHLPLSFARGVKKTYFLEHRFQSDVCFPT